MHSPIECRKILTFFRKGNIDIALVQKTHLDDKEHLKLKQGYFSQVFFSSFTTRSWGVAVLIKRNLPFKVMNCAKDKNNRYILIKGTLQGQDIVIMNFYYPPGHSFDFLTKIFLELVEMTSDLVIIRSDFNRILNPLIDRFPHSTMAPSSHAIALHNLCEDFGFEGIWRNVHLSDKGYTFFSAPHGCQTRIDYVFLPGTLLESVLSCNIDTLTISDHACVIMDMKLKNPINQTRQWRINTVVLKR